MLVVVSPTVRRMLDRAGAGRGRLPARPAARGSASPIPPNTTADRAGDLLAAASALAYLQWTRATGHARGRPADRPDPRAGRRAGRAPERRRRLALGRRHEGPAPAERPDDLGAGRLGAGRGRAARPADRRRRRSTRRPTWLAQEFAKVDGGDHETRADAPARPEHPQARRRFEQANALNRRPPGPLRRRRWPTWR